jgi:hypothetical protein
MNILENINYLIEVTLNKSLGPKFKDITSDTLKDARRFGKQAFNKFKVTKNMHDKIPSSLPKAKEIMLSSAYSNLRSDLNLRKNMIKDTRDLMRSIKY